MTSVIGVIVRIKWSQVGIDHFIPRLFDREFSKAVLEAIVVSMIV